MNNSKSELLFRIVQLTQEMLHEAESSSWEHVGELEQSRQQLIEKCFPLDQSITLEQADSQIRMIINLNKKIVGMASKEQKDIAKILRDLSLGRQAVSTYRQVEQH